jgi:hypothetical protein
VEHRKNCAEQKAKWEIERAEFVAKHPNHCRKCNGTGGFYSQYDPSPAGVSLGAGFMVDWDSCSECSDNGLCPLCGGIVFAVYDEKAVYVHDACQMCGYNTDMTDENPPAEFECFCYEDNEPW